MVVVFSSNAFTHSELLAERLANHLASVKWLSATSLASSLEALETLVWVSVGISLLS